MKGQFFKEELIRRGALVLTANLSAGMIAFFTNLIISNILVPTSNESFGVFKTVIYLFSFLPMLIDFGINASLIKYISEFGKERFKETKYLIRWFLKIKIISYLFLIAALFLIKDYITIYFLKDVSLNYLALAGIFLTGSIFFTTFSPIVQGLQNFKFFSFSLFLNAALPGCLSILLSSFGVFYMIIGWGLGSIIGNLPSILFLFKKRIFTDYKKINMKKLFYKFSLPIYPTEFITSLSTVSVPLLSLFFSQKLMSYYSFAFLFYWAAQLIPGSLSTVLFPKVSELSGLGKYEHAKNILKKAFYYYSLAVIIGLICVFLFSEWFINIVAKDYLPSLTMFKIIFSLSFIFGYNMIYSNYLKGLSKVKKYALFILAQNIFLILISFFLLSSMFYIS